MKLKKPDPSDFYRYYAPVSSNGRNQLLKPFRYLYRAFANRTPRFWIILFALYFAYEIGRLTFWSDFAIERDRRIENAPPPTQDQLRSMLTGKTK